MKRYMSIVIATVIVAIIVAVLAVACRVALTVRRPRTHIFVHSYRPPPV